ncbi:acryloyl-CoA reductase [Devosia sp.]|uniref:acrylyl-CoA reductase family protein n=1 Tax=Devosia sp. TaxID=1871048 RepID=UPI003A8F55D9
MSFEALVSRKDDAGTISSTVETLEDLALPDRQVLVGVEWAGFNYKDALCLTGRGKLVRNFPHVAGIDFAGQVIESADERYQPGQAVVLTGWRVGEMHWGGFSQRARVDPDWLVPVPKGLSPRTAMMIGTAGLAAMLSVNRLQAEGIRPGDGEVLVTGAGGGVGTLAVMLLSRLGYEVAAVSGRSEMVAPLEKLGASRVLGRDALNDSGKVLDKEQWSSAIDTVGGAMLGELLKQIRYGGVVAAVGNAGGVEFAGNVIPFLLRGVSLCGIDTVMQPFAERQSAWGRLTELFREADYESFISEAGLADLPELAEKILAGQVAGRVIVNPRAT